jgi:hypothetical protein
LNRYKNKLALVFIGPVEGSEGYQALTELKFQNENLFLLGRYTPQEVEACLELSDVNFLPYPFWNKTLVTESFPSKLPKYVGSLRPILLLAPAYSSPTEFLKSQSVQSGLVTVMSKTNLSNEIINLLENKSVIESQIQGLRRINQEVFSKKIFSKNLSDVFNLQIENYEEINSEIEYFNVPVQESWVQKANMLIRNTSFMIENYRRPRFVARSFVLRYRQAIKLGIISNISRIIGPERYKKYIYGQASKLKIRHQYFRLRVYLVPRLRRVFGAHAYEKYVTNRFWKNRKGG